LKAAVAGGLLSRPSQHIKRKQPERDHSKRFLGVYNPIPCGFIRGMKRAPYQYLVTPSVIPGRMGDMLVFCSFQHEQKTTPKTEDGGCLMDSLNLQNLRTDCF
jgi:hypothetical protein